MIIIEEEELDEDKKDGGSNNDNDENSLPYLMKFTGRFEELFHSMQCCSQWPAESDVRLYYNCLPKIPMMDMKGKKFIPLAGARQFDLIIFTSVIEFSKESRFTAFSITPNGPTKKFANHIKKIIRFISKAKMTKLDFVTVHSLITDIKQFDDWQRYGFFFPITIVK